MLSSVAVWHDSRSLRYRVHYEPAVAPIYRLYEKDEDVAPVPALRGLRDWRHSDGRDGQTIGWLPTIFFAMGIPVSVIQLLPNSSFLTVSEDGIEFRSLFRATKLRWSDISEFGVYTIRHHGMSVSRFVGFNYSAEYRGLATTRALSKAVAGFEGGLPDTYGFSANELAQLLSTYHREKTRINV